ncbi:MarR family transcriptional regulator [Streptomyces sp. NPDC005485]|uniref:MarR family transcriptional regulator n=1 Tax=Streptomyces sp. NPDC005485 TaxID=3155591 RepID=UPI0033B8E3E4
MSGIRDSLGRVGYDLLSRALAECGREAATGELRVSGKPGGLFHLRGGLVVAVESPGAPGPEVLLLRSGRIGAEQWAELLSEARGARWPEAAMIAHGYAGAAQLRVICMMAMQDAAFAVVAGRVDGCAPLGPSVPRAPVEVGESPGRLLQGAVRKLTAVAALPGPVRPDRERPVLAPGVDPDSDQLPLAQRELLSHIDGRRTARDLAFLVGRGVYTVTVEIARMLGEGLLECAEGAAGEERGAAPVVIPVRARETGVRRRVTGPGGAAQGGAAKGGATHGGAAASADKAVSPSPAPDAPDAPEIPEPPSASQLPRRDPGASGITETLAPEKNGASWKGFFRLRHRIWTPDSGT